jgi:hypothetical protein
MTLCNDCFEDFVHPLIHAGMAKNEAFFEKFGRHERWDWDDVSSILTFSDSTLPTVRVHCSVVGTTEGNSWEWSWANENWPAHNKLDMDKIREFGEANGYEKLTTSILDADEYTGWEMTAVTEHLLDALGAYRFPTEDGFCYLAFRRIDVVGILPQQNLPTGGVNAAIPSP